MTILVRLPLAEQFEQLVLELCRAREQLAREHRFHLGHDASPATVASSAISVRKLCSACPSPLCLLLGLRCASATARSFSAARLLIESIDQLNELALAFGRDRHVDAEVERGELASAVGRPDGEAEVVGEAAVVHHRGGIGLADQRAAQALMAGLGRGSGHSVAPKSALSRYTCHLEEPSCG